MRQFGDMSLRMIVAIGCAGIALSAVVAIGLAAWLLPRELADGGAGVPVTAMWGALAIVAVLATAIGVALDRHLLARRHDRRNLPARPEFFDFDAVRRPLHGEEIAGKPLKQLCYVVFDTETTGLRPGQGDEIISIAAVRLEAGVIDEAGAFSRLVDPGRPIPPASIRFHGITDAMVAGERPIGEVLPAFRDFVGDAILVAHNADFDMSFLDLKKRESGVEITNIVLDTLLIAMFVEHNSRNHSLDAIAERLGIAIEGRHTALGDSLATARIFWKQLDYLEARGITTLGQALDASASIAHMRRTGHRV